MRGPHSQPGIRVGQLIKGLGRGGAEALLPMLVRAWAERVSVSAAFLLPWKDALVEDLRSAGATVECLRAGPAATLPLAVLRASRWLRARRIQLLHCHLPVAGVVGRLAARLVGTPVVYTEHNLLERYHPWTRRAHLATWRLQDAVVAVSGEVRESILRHAPGGVPVHVVLNGIDVQRLRAVVGMAGEVRRALEIPGGAPVMGTVAVFRAQKRLDLWLEAAAAVCSQIPFAHVLLVGDGPLRGELENQAARLLPPERVHFVGLQADIRPYLAAMDVFVMSSRFEGLPVALLEAMAAGVAVVSTSVGGVPEVLEKDRTGLLVPAGDIEALAAAVWRLLADGQERTRLANAAQVVVTERFSIERMAEELLRIYTQLLEERRRARAGGSA